MSTERMNEKTTSKIAGEIWLDYVEGEVEKSFKEDLDKILINDVSERQTMLQLKGLKTHILDNSGELPGDAVFDKLKANIMAEVYQSQPDKKIATWNRTQIKGLLMVSAAAFSFVLGTVFTQVSHQSRSRAEKSVERAAQAMVQNEDIYNEVIETQQGNDDFILDSAVDKLNTMPKKQAEKVIENL